MLAKTKLPRTLLWITNLMVIYLLLFTACRLLMTVLFLPADARLTDLLPAFALGLRFDLRWISLLLLPIVLGSFFPAYSPFSSLKARRVWTWYLAGVTFAVVFFFAADFGCFSYNKTRLNASALNFAEDPGTSVQMLWQSYPLFWMLAGLVALVFGLRWLFTQTHIWVSNHALAQPATHRHAPFVVTTALFALLIYGGFSSQPLRWTTAFGLHDSFRAYIALNPLQNFFTTLKFRQPSESKAEAEKYFGLMKDWMALPEGNSFTYKRNLSGTNLPFAKKPNVVLVLCESFSMYKSSMSGNALNTTPYFNELSQQGVFFEHCFTPHFSTARGLFATLTGIPDVQLSKFSTRNPEALNQHTIINNFEGYKKMYFLGGDPAFNNFKGLLQNIDGLEMHTGPRPTQPSASVWGISDKDLFLEANDKFAQEQQPFFAIIQTADNHRPFSVPLQDPQFGLENIHPDTLQHWGFESVEEYNAFRYSDYCFKTFIEAAKKEKYYSNTLFVFIGDHGVSGNATAVYNPVWTDERLTDQHVPLLFYAPGWLHPQRRSEVVSQVDVLPTIAGITGESYINTTLGRDVFRPFNPSHYAFIIQHDAGQIGMVNDEVYFTKNLNFKAEELHFLNYKNQYTIQQQDSIKHRLSDLTTAYYETAKWMLLHNKP